MDWFCADTIRTKRGKNTIQGIVKNTIQMFICFPFVRLIMFHQKGKIIQLPVMRKKG